MPVPRFQQSHGLWTTAPTKQAPSVSTAEAQEEGRKRRLKGRPSAPAIIANLALGRSLLTVPSPNLPPRALFFQVGRGMVCRYVSLSLANARLAASLPVSVLCQTVIPSTARGGISIPC